MTKSLEVLVAELSGALAEHIQANRVLLEEIDGALENITQRIDVLFARVVAIEDRLG